MALITRESVLSLMDQFKGPGMVFSCFADLTVAAGFHSDCLAKIGGIAAVLPDEVMRKRQQLVANQ